MAWPTIAVVTTGMDADTDTVPRSDILDLTTKFNEVIAARAQAGGVCDLDGSALVPVARIPLSIARLTLTGNQAINEARANIVMDATLMNLWAGPSILDGTGTATTITLIANAPQAGARRFLYPVTGSVLVHGANFDIDGNANRTAAAGERWEFIAKSVNTFRVYVTKDDGTPVTNTSPSIQIFYANGTYTKPAGLTGLRVTVVGGGGSGAGGTVNAGGGAGGGGGGTSIRIIAAVSIMTTEVVTVGAGASGGAVGVNGGTGGTSSFGPHASATGGTGGGANGNSGGTGGIGTGAGVAVNIAGGGGSSVGGNWGGAGGSSTQGGGAGGAAAGGTVIGFDGRSFGGGGGGGSTNGGANATAGGGAPGGIVIVEEFF